MMILHPARFRRSCHHQLCLAIDYTPLHHLMIVASSAALPECPVAPLESSAQWPPHLRQHAAADQDPKIRTPPPRQTLTAIGEVSQE
jgi:hypothetical protein